MDRRTKSSEQGVSVTSTTVTVRPKAPPAPLQVAVYRRRRSPRALGRSSLRAKALEVAFAGLIISVLAAPFLLNGCGAPAADADLEALNIDAAELGRTRHFVTTQMELESKAMASRVAPAFTRKDGYGTEVRVGNGPRPQFVLFIKRGCPCSIDAQVLFSKLALKFKDSVEFVGVIDKGGKEYATQFRASFPVVDEPSLGLMRAYDARASVFSALVARNGHIVKMWPGYSAAWLKEMNALLSKASAKKETPFDPEYAPKERSTGCAFGQT